MFPGAVGPREGSLGSSQSDNNGLHHLFKEPRAFSLSVVLGITSLYRLFSQSLYTKDSKKDGKSSLEDRAPTVEQKESDYESELARLRDEVRRLKEALKNYQKETEDVTAKVNAETSKNFLIEALGKELESLAEEIEHLKAELSQHKLGYTKAYGHLQRLLSEFVIACMELPPCEKSSKLDKAFQTFREEATKLLPPELSKSLLVALDVASSEEARENALRDSDDEDVVDLAAAKRKIKKIRKTATEKTTHGLRRGRKAEMELKEVREEYEKKVNELTLENSQLKEKYRRERRRNADMEKALGSNSDYALFAAESVRSFVERCEMDRRELSQRVTSLESELKELLRRFKETEIENEKLSEEVKRAPNGIDKHVAELKAQIEDLKMRKSSQSQHQTEAKSAKAAEVDKSKETLQREARYRSNEILMRGLSEECQSLEPNLAPRYDPLNQGALSLPPKATYRDSGVGSLATSSMREKTISCLKCKQRFTQQASYEKHLWGCYGVRPK